MTEEAQIPVDVAALALAWKAAREEDGLIDVGDPTELWRWRFESAPGAVDAVADDSGAFAVIPGRVNEAGDPARWALATATGRAGDLGKRFVKTAGGMGEGIHTFYLLHTERTGALMRESIGFETVRDQNRLMLGASGFEGGDLVPEPLDGWSDPLAALLSERLPGERAERIRDEAWFRWRFLDAPVAGYRIHGVRAGEKLAGYAVTRTEELFGERATWAVDWHVPSGDPIVVRALASAVTARASTDGAERAGWILPDTVPDWITLQLLGARMEPTRHFLDVRTFSRQTTDRWLHQNWAYTLADFDLV